ncbi:bridging integrator 3-like isoform X1 [Varroa jacobsoni]|uniref:BAR domain-containing protein n=2 Tax=Varroa destructor TaxID=109461 RepID=A0A7M7MAS8_VARDE|nr:bridging integrator 3-like isoform X1 [Varroa destructor]XP_022688734.1 bridging integrator 3-like isoform X1 [Varroa jacobsoni]
MNWNPLKRLSARPSGKDTPTSPEWEAPMDSVDEIVSRYHRLEVNSKKLHKSAKKYEDMMLALYQSEKKLCGDMVNDDFCKEHDDLRRTIEEWLCYASEMDQAVDDHVIAVRRCLVDPMKRYQSTFPDVQAAVKKRDQLVQEHLRMVQKVAKLETKEATGNNIAKLAESRRQVEILANELEAQNTLLRSELPAIYEHRVEYIQPCLHALILSQTVHWGEATSRLQKCFPSLNKSCRSDAETSQYHRDKLNAIKSLSIVAGSD